MSTGCMFVRSSHTTTFGNGSITSIRWQISKSIKVVFDIFALTLTVFQILTFEIFDLEKVTEYNFQNGAVHYKISKCIVIFLHFLFFWKIQPVRTKVTRTHTHACTHTHIYIYIYIYIRIHTRTQHTRAHTEHRQASGSRRNLADLPKNVTNEVYRFSYLASNDASI